MEWNRARGNGREREDYEKGETVEGEREKRERRKKEKKTGMLG